MRWKNNIVVIWVAFRSYVYFRMDHDGYLISCFCEDIRGSLLCQRTILLACCLDSAIVRDIQRGSGNNVDLSHLWEHTGRTVGEIKMYNLI